MQTTLAIDCGNTRIKLAFFNGNTLVADHSFGTGDVKPIKQLILKHRPSHVILSNVGKTLNAELTEVLKKTSLMELKQKTKVPINVKYSYASLGADRLALAVHAHDFFPKHNALVVSAGTCITYNLVDKNGDYSGGIISPGLHMRLLSMHEQTARLPKVKLQDNVQLIGDTTETSMNSGAVLGAAYEINGFIKEYKRQYNGLKVILTGGDADRLQPHLNFRIFARPNAVLEGLHRILQYNIGAL